MTVPDETAVLDRTAVLDATAVPQAPAVPLSVPAGADVASVVLPMTRRIPLATRPAATAIRPVRRSKSKRPLKIAVVLLAIPGMFLTAALPAYAFSPGVDEGIASSAQSRIDANAQDVTVAAGAAAVTVARDGFTATTAEELAQREADAVSAQRAVEAASAASAASAAFAVYTVRSEGDDYPWFDQATDNQGGGLSPLGYYYRECVDFVAWRLNRDAGSTSAPWAWTWSTLTPGGGNASSWANAWASHGWATSNTPVVGAVAWFNYNHVAYVQSINSDGSVVLEEYNWNSSHAYHTRTVSASEVPLFLYPPA